MSQAPDFEQLTHEIVVAAFAARFSDGMIDASDLASITERLRLLWNARGAADLATVQVDLPGAASYALVRVIRKLDR